MHATVRRYDHATDYRRIGEFLVKTYRTMGRHFNWLQPRWEYMHFHPLIERVDLDAIGIWEVDGEIVGVVHPEHSMGRVYFEVAPGYGDLERDMLAYAEQNLAGASDAGRIVKTYINDSDVEFQDLAAARGYEKVREGEEMSRFVIPEPFPEISLPPGFSLKSLADDNDMAKVHRVLWRGFDHEGEPPPAGVEGRVFMQSAPNFRNDLNIVVEAPDGDFASYCGMWYEPMHRIAYVEPVATDPDYRRLGLGRAVVLEGIRRCGVKGATVAYVGSEMHIYRSIGFSLMYRLSVWQRTIR